MSALLQILSLALILAINNFFGAVSLGATPLDRRRRWAITGLFALSDCGLPLIGVLLGASLARALGPAASYLGIGLIILTGAYLLFGYTRAEPEHGIAADIGVGPLIFTAVALGLDNLGAAIGLGATGVNLPLTLVTFGVVTGCVTALGLAVGELVHHRLPGRAANGLAGILLAGTGLTMLVGRLR